MYRRKSTLHGVEIIKPFKVGNTCLLKYVAFLAAPGTYILLLDNLGL